ncbi:MAG: beta strand repeat-containing protein, partial [Candidatus Competibacteraceae bacterium]
ITAACTVSASFTQQTYAVTAIAGANGSISPASRTVAHGATTTFTVIPSASYSAVVSGCGGMLSGTTYTTGPITAACTVSASFTQQTYAVTATAGANGSISPASRTVANGSTTTFTVTPNASYSAVVSGCGGTLSGTTYTTGPITAACTVSASFSQIETTFTVTTLNDSGAGSLRQAVLDANAAPDANTITFQNGLTGTITLTTGELTITAPLTITGPGATALTLSGNRTSRLVTVNPGVTATLAGLALKNGQADIWGGAIQNRGTLTVTDSVVSDNLSHEGGGGIVNWGTLTVINTTLAGNAARVGGGGIYSVGTALGIQNSTFTANTANSGGAIDNRNPATILNSTMSGNTAYWGGGLMNFDNLTLIQTTVTGNSSSGSSGGGIYNGIFNLSESNNLIVSNSLIAGNTATSGGKEIDNSGNFTSQGHNLFGENGDSGLGGATPAASDLILAGAISTALAPLADNGGPTLTHLLVAGSPASNAGDNALIPDGTDADQRGAGFPRILNGMVDIGAVETTATHTIGGAVTGLGSGKSVTLLNNGGDSRIVAANGAFTFTTPVASGGSYAVTVGAQPTGQICTVSSGSGTATTNVTTVAVTCATNTYTIGGSLSGLGSDKSVTLLNNSGDSRIVAANGVFTFTTLVASGGGYAVTVGTQPTGQICTVSNGAGTATANVITVAVNCATTTYTLTVAKTGNGSGTVSGGGTFPYNTPVAPTATATVGSTFAGWSPASCASPFNLIANTTCTANFTLKTYPLTAVGTPTFGGSISPASRTVNHGVKTTFIIVPTTGYQAIATGCGGTLNSVTRVYTTGPITAACRVIATFKPVLTVGKTGTGAGLITGSGLNCGPTCTASYTLNTVVLLTAKEAPGSAFAGWVGGCTVNPANPRQCTATMNVTKTVQTRFNTTTPGTTALSVYKTGAGLGTVVSTAPLPMGKINCGSVCVANFPTTATVTLTATPASGSTFAGWIGCTPKLGLPLQCTVPMNFARVVKAAFTRPVLTVTKTGAGLVTSTPAGINCGPICTAPYNLNTSVTLTAIPGTGFRFGSWVGCTPKPGVPLQCTVAMNQAKTVTAAFIR